MAPDAPPAEQPSLLKGSLPWLLIAWFGALAVALYYPILKAMAGDWSTNEDMGHGFFVPVVAGYIIWQMRPEILARSYQPNWLGLLIVLYSGLQLFVATLGVELFLARTAFIECLVGIVFCLGGWPLTRHLLFPLFLLVFMVPLPAVIYTQITFPLQLLATRLAEIALSAVGIPVFRDGNILELPSQQLSVVEACSGIRSLLSLSFLSLVYGHLFDRKAWMKWVLLIFTVPIAISVNAFRVTLTGLLSEIDPELASGAFHTFEGWVIFLAALILLVVTHWLLNFIYRRSHGTR